MLTLIIGGSGSGKSALAESLACSLPGPRIYLATMSASDRESLDRIARHRKMRIGKGFQTMECSTNLSALVVPKGSVILLEDLSNLLANELFLPDGGGIQAVSAGLSRLKSQARYLIVVTNEVFVSGSFYDNETLQYMYHLADLNRALAYEADLVVEAVCGLPNILKGYNPWL